MTDRLKDFLLSQPERPMTGFFDQLTPEQKARALARGPDHGSRDGHFIWFPGDIEHHDAETVQEKTISQTDYHNPVVIKNTPIGHAVSREGETSDRLHSRLSEHSLQHADNNYPWFTHNHYKRSSSHLNDLLRHQKYRTGELQMVMGKASPEQIQRDWNEGGARAKLHHHINNMDRLTSHPTKFSFTVYRGAYGESAEHVKLPVGSTFTDHGFTGTSLSKRTAYNFGIDGRKRLPEGRVHLFAIHVPKGTKGHYMDFEHEKASLSEEKEFVLHRGTTFRVRGHSFDPDTGAHITHVVVHHQPEKPAEIPEPVIKKPRGLGEFLGENAEHPEEEIAGKWKPVSGHTETHTFDGGFMHDGKHTWYVKSGADDEHLRVEHLSNRLYRHLGVRSPETKLVRHNGDLKLASKKIEGARPVSPAKLPGHPDIHKGFVADSWLGAWDVAGMDHSNLVADHAGNIHRIDQGGTLHRRAMGGTKHFSTPVEELHSLRDPSRPTGRMFARVNDQEIHRGIAHLARTMTNDVLDHHVRAAGFEGEHANRIVANLAARRDHLAAKIDPERERHLTWQQGEIQVHPRTIEERLAGDSYDAPTELGGKLRARLMFHHHFERNRLKAKFEMHEQIAEKQRKKFSPQHEQWINRYKDKSHKINDYLRGVTKSKLSPKFSKEVHRDGIKHLDEVTNHPSPTSFIAYRGVNPKHVSIHELPRGATFTDHGYTGVSLSREEARFFGSDYKSNFNEKRHILSIHVPKGTKGHFLDTKNRFNSFNNEKEFLLQRGTTFKVHGHSYDPVSNTHITHVVVHSQKKKPVDYSNYQENIFESQLDEKLAKDNYEEPFHLKNRANFGRRFSRYGEAPTPVIDAHNREPKADRIHERHAEVAMRQRKASGDHEVSRDYYKEDSYTINRILRQGLKPPTTSRERDEHNHNIFHADYGIDPEKHHEVVNHLDHLTSHPTEFAFTGYRGASFKRSETKFSAGTTFTDHGFTGMSLRKDIALTFSKTNRDNNSKKAHVFAIHVPKGSKGHYLDADPEDKMAEEKEFVLKRGTTFRVRGHSYDPHNDVHVTHLTVHEQKEPREGLAWKPYTQTWND